MLMAVLAPLLILSGTAMGGQAVGKQPFGFWFIGDDLHQAEGRSGRPGLQTRSIRSSPSLDIDHPIVRLFNDLNQYAERPRLKRSFEEHSTSKGFNNQIPKELLSTAIFENIFSNTKKIPIPRIKKSDPSGINYRLVGQGMNG